jgi:hypothetical protein
VETVAGTGRQARSANEAGRGRGVALNSPWDLARVPGISRALAQKLFSELH